MWTGAALKILCAVQDYTAIKQLNAITITRQEQLGVNLVSLSFTLAASKLTTNKRDYQQMVLFFNNKCYYMRLHYYARRKSQVISLDFFKRLSIYYFYLPVILNRGIIRRHGFYYHSIPFIYYRRLILCVYVFLPRLSAYLYLFVCLFVSVY